MAAASTFARGSSVAFRRGDLGVIGVLVDLEANSGIVAVSSDLEVSAREWTFTIGDGPGAQDFALVPQNGS